MMDKLGFNLDEDVLPGSSPANRIPYLNHGKYITRNRAGLWFCGFIFDRAFRDRNWLALTISDRPQQLGREFQPVLLLVGRSDSGVSAVLEYEGKFIGGCALMMDDADRLHVFYELETGIHRVTANAAGSDARQRLANATAWSKPEHLTDAGSLLGDVVGLPSGELALYFTHQDALFEKIGSNTPVKIVDHAAHPSACVDAKGVRHIACERDRRIFYVRSDKNAPAPEMVAHFCSSWPSIASTDDGKVIIAYQGEGKAVLYRDWQLYKQLREAGGSTISYAVLDGGNWSLHDLIRSREIVLKRRPHHRHPQVDPTFIPFMEELWRPSLAVDRHGVVWMFYVNTTRRHIYWSRFDGQTFGERYEARGPFDCMERELFLQKESRGGDAIGFMMRAGKQMYFDTIPVPGYASTEKRRVVFLDNLETDRVIGLEHRLGIWQKHLEPVFGSGISGDERDDHVAWCQVWPRDGGFEMQYMGMGDLYSNCVRGRAFSKDGIQWEKRPPFDHTRMTIDGKPFPDRFWRPSFLEDPAERDPRRRFKGLLGAWQHVRGWELRWYKVVASPDGTNWHTVEGIQPVTNGDISISLHLIRDDEDRDPNRRFKFLSCSGGQSGRTVVMFTSPDLLNWHDPVYLRENPNDLQSAFCPYPTGPVPLDADGAEHPWEEEIHDAYQWREHGLMMFHYDSFYFGANQHVEKALAVSRDGRHYWRVKRGAINLPHGAAGAWDSGRVRTGLPIRVGDELRLYYCGMPASYFDDPDAKGYVPPVWADAWSHNTTARGLELRPWKVGLAKLRADGWAYLQLARDAQSGHLTTIPFEYGGGQLVVNGTGLGSGGIRVEVRTAENAAVVPGFDAASSRFSNPDAVRSSVAWSGDKTLEPGTYRLRFVFDGLRSKLYAFGFQT